MDLKELNRRIIFGLKVKHLRQEKGYSSAELAEQAGLSVSYLNEIEKGKKYPKEDKIQGLVKALDVSLTQLTSPKLTPSQAPLEALLRSNFLNELPLEFFGIELSKVAEIIASAPTKVGAFISTLIEMARNYALREENFYFGAVRAYQELNFNYFDEIESAVATFSKEHGINKQTNITSFALKAILEDEFGIVPREGGLTSFPELRNLRSLFLENKKELLLKDELDELQLRFQLAKEIGFQHLQLKERSATSRLIKVENFEQVLNHFKASYFAIALLMNKAFFIKDIKQLFSSKSWNAQLINTLMQKYQASPEMLFQRFSNILPTFFGLSQIFVLRVTYHQETQKYKIDNELHLSKKHRPHSNGLSEHYCRRWLAISLLEEMHQTKKSGKYFGAIVGAQRSSFMHASEEYLTISVASDALQDSAITKSLTLGILLDKKSKAKVSFWNDPAIPQRAVNITCERCDLMDCQERAAPPIIVEQKNQRKTILDIVDKLKK